MIDENKPLDQNDTSESPPQVAEPAATTELSPQYPPPIPKFTAAVLFILCIASLGTGIYYWYTTYFDNTAHATPAIANIADINPAPHPEHVEYLPEQDGYTPVQYEPDQYLPYVPIAPLRPVLDPRPQFVALWEEYGNEDITGHLFIPGTALDIYVVQANDNAFYREFDIFRQPSPTGWVFVDYGVDIQLDFELNIVLHGYAGSVLQQTIREYMEYDFFLAHPVITFNTRYAEYDWEIFAFYVAPPDFPFAAIDPPFEEWGDIVEMFTLASFYNTRLDVTEYDQVLTLSAPTAAGSDLFYVLQARLLRHITS